MITLKTDSMAFPSEASCLEEVFVNVTRPPILSSSFCISQSSSNFILQVRKT